MNQAITPLKRSVCWKDHNHVFELTDVIQSMPTSREHSPHNIKASFAWFETLHLSEKSDCPKAPRSSIDTTYCHPINQTHQTNRIIRKRGQSVPKLDVKCFDNHENYPQPPKRSQTQLTRSQSIEYLRIVLPNSLNYPRETFTFDCDNCHQCIDVNSKTGKCSCGIIYCDQCIKNGQYKIIQ